jgi:hypothetical protein
MKRENAKCKNIERRLNSPCGEVKRALRTIVMLEGMHPTHEKSMGLEENVEMVLTLRGVGRSSEKESGTRSLTEHHEETSKPWGNTSF